MVDPVSQSSTGVHGTGSAPQEAKSRLNDVYAQMLTKTCKQSDDDLSVEKAKLDRIVDELENIAQLVKLLSKARDEVGADKPTALGKKLTPKEYADANRLLDQIDLKGLFTTNSYAGLTDASDAYLKDPRTLMAATAKVRNEPSLIRATSAFTAKSDYDKGFSKVAADVHMSLHRPVAGGLTSAATGRELSQVCTRLQSHLQSTATRHSMAMAEASEKLGLRNNLYEALRKFIDEIVGRLSRDVVNLMR